MGADPPLPTAGSRIRWPIASNRAAMYNRVLDTRSETLADVLRHFERPSATLAAAQVSSLRVMPA